MRLTPEELKYLKVVLERTSSHNAREQIDHPGLSHKNFSKQGRKRYCEDAHMNMLLSLFFAATMWVQVPQWSDDWSNCAVDVPTVVVIGIVDVDNTFGDGFDWETAPWFDVNGF